MDITMDNQQETRQVTELELAWLAGMFNGDGCFSVVLRTKQSGRLACDVSLTLTQTDAGLIEAAMDIIERLTGYAPYVNERAPCSNGVRPVMHMREGKMAHIAMILPRIIPHMRGEKGAKARIMLRYINNRLKYAGQSKKQNLIENDLHSLSIVSEFYEAQKKPFPKEVTRLLNDFTPNTGIQ